MSTSPRFRSRKLPLILILLIGALSASAITFGDSILPLGLVREGSFFASLSDAPTGLTNTGIFEATVTTDKPEYAPGQYVQISGSGWWPNETVRLQVDHLDTGAKSSVSSAAAHEGHEPWDVTADRDGNIDASWIVDEDAYGQTLVVTALGLSSGQSASTTFIDAIGYNKGVYNKDNFDPVTTGDWTTGNAGSHYEEGQWVSYQYQVAGITGTTPSFDIKFNHLDPGSQNAIFIDAFTNLRACVDCTEDSFTSGPKEGMLLDDVQFPSPTSTKWVDAKPAISFINGTLNSSGVCVATEDPVNIASQEHCFHVDGTALQNLFSTNFSTGTHTITLFYEAHLANTRTWKNGKEYLLGCPTSVHYVAPGPHVVPADTVYGTEAYSGGNACLQDNAGDWTGIYNGVGFASGSSRHFNIINQTAGSNGGLSLPIPSVEAPTGTITIVKVTQPSPAVGTFGFDGDLGPFNLDTDTNTGTPSSITFGDIPANVPLTVSEEDLPADWVLTDIACVGTTGSNFQYSSTGATITLPSVNNAIATATCTFTNTNDNLLKGRIIVKKETTPSGDSQSFVFTPSWTGVPPYTNGKFNLSDGQQNDSCGAGNPNCLVKGSYSVAETVPDDWQLTSASCTSSLGDLPDQPSNIDLREGEVITCTFKNTKLTASLTVTKTPSVTDVCAGSDSPVTYTYEVKNTGTAALTVNLSDDKLGDVDGGTGFSLAAGASKTYTKSTTINTTTTNTVTASGTTAGGQTASATASATVTARTCTISLTKTPSVTSVCAGSDTSVTYTYVVKNTGDFFNVSGSVTDDKLGSIGSYGPLAPGETKSLTKTATINATTTNTGTATGTFSDADATTASATASATVTSRTCTISLTKTPDITKVCIGSTTTVTYTYVVKNTGDFFSVSGTVSDDKIGSIGSYGPLAPGESKTLTGTATIGATTTNVATANGTFSDADATSSTATAQATVTGYVCTISITKAPDKEKVCNGTVVNYTIKVTNNSPQFDWTGDVVDDVIGTLDTGVTIKAGESKTYTPSGAVTGTVKNTVTASGNFGDPDGTSASAKADATVVGYVCTISITKTPDKTEVCNGASVTYTYVVKNNSTAGGFSWTGSLNDDKLGEIEDSFTLAPGASSTFTAGGSITGTVNNTGTASGKFDDGSETSASAQASATVEGKTCRIIVKKVTVPTDSTQKFAFAGDLSGSIGNGETIEKDVLAPGTFGTAETVPDGWTLTSRVCDDSDSGPSGSFAVSYKLAVGETITCIFTNKRLPTLTLIKTVINDNGGLLEVKDFPLFISGSPATSGQKYTLNPNSYKASETNQYGYTASAWGTDCAANGDVTLAYGDNKVCTITNDDQPGKIIIIKETKPAGSPTSFTFTTTGTGYSGFSLTDGQSNTQTLNRGTYTAKELVPLGWALTDLACSVSGSGGSTGVGDPLGTQSATIELANGDTVTCTFVNTGQGVTRTQGFWATHPELAEIAWNGGSGYGFGNTLPGVGGTTGITDNLICGRAVMFNDPNLDPPSSLMGGFWSAISKLTDGKKRSALDQARMQLLQQLLAAELNASAFGAVPSGGSAQFAAWEGALCGTDVKAISTAQGQAASFNTFGDSGLFTPGISANSKGAREIANLQFWNIIKP